MLKSLYDLARTIFLLGERVQEDRDELREVRRDLRDLTLLVERLAAQIAHLGEREEREREMLVLRLENSIHRSRGGRLLVGETDGGG